MIKSCLLISLIGLIYLPILSLNHLFVSIEKEVPDKIRIPLELKENVFSSVFMVLTFDKVKIDEVLAKKPLKLPEPLPSGAKIGYLYPDDFFVLLEKREEKDKVYLTVDANRNDDLTDDAWVELLAMEKEGVIIKIKRIYVGDQPKEVWLPYRFRYSQRTGPKGEIEDNIFVSAAYLRQGEFDFQGKKYVLELDDFRLRGKFDQNNLSAGTVLSVYPKEEQLSPRKGLFGFELIPFGDEFFEVSECALDGSWIELHRNTDAQAALGRVIPDYELKDIEGKNFHLSDYRGKFLLLDFWPSWCQPCLEKFPLIKATLEKYANQPLTIIGINLDEEKRIELAKKIIKDYGLTWRQVIEGKGYFLPIYKILGRLPEQPMSFPLYVLIDPKGVIRYATNDFLKMQRFLEFALNERQNLNKVLFIPLAFESLKTEAKPQPIDFGSQSLQALLKKPELKLPSDLTKEARIGRLPNGTIVIVRPSESGDKWLLRLDKERNFDLTEEQEKEIPILNEFPKKPDEVTRFNLVINFEKGGRKFLNFGFFALSSEEREKQPEIYYIGFEEIRSGQFVYNNEEYRITIFDPTYDGLFTAEDAQNPDILTLKNKQNGQWEKIFTGINNIPIGNQLFRLKHINDDGELIELELISSSF